MIDLIDLKSYKSTNRGFPWVLNIVDVYSKYAKALPLKSKSASEVADALQSLLFTFGPPSILQCDNGKEFTNSLIKNLCDVINLRSN
jgi:transposase InsO family protein